MHSEKHCLQGILIAITSDPIEPLLYSPSSIWIPHLSADPINVVAVSGEAVAADYLALEDCYCIAQM